MTYPLIFYTDNLPEWMGGCANGPVIRIRPKYKYDAGILKHELQHVKQWFATLGLHSLLYLVSKRYRQWAEVQAYRAQMRWPDRNGYCMDIDYAAELLATKYDLGISTDEAKELL